MSVPTYKRSENKLDVSLKAKKILITVIALIKYDDILRKSENSFIRDSLFKSAIQLLTHISVANSMSLKANNSEFVLERLKNQLLAREDMYSMIILSEAMVDMNDVSDTDKIENLLVLLDEFKTLFYAWTKHTREFLKNKHVDVFTKEQSEHPSVE